MREQLATALKDAEANEDPVRTTTLRLVTAAIRDRDLAARSEESAEGAGEADISRLLRTMVAQRNASAEAYEEDGQLDLAERERREAEVILEFLPKPLTKAEVDAAIADAVTETGASSIKDLGRVMTLLKKRYTDRIDYGLIGSKVLDALS
ncbi:MAG: GatB/YqeY domain-containing protein [Pseudomonadota bacterium]